MSEYTNAQKETIAEAMSDAWIDGAAQLLQLNFAKLNLAAAGVARKVKNEFQNIKKDDVENFIEQTKLVVFYAEKLQKDIGYFTRKVEFGASRLRKVQKPDEFYCQN